VLADLLRDQATALVESWRALRGQGGDTYGDERSSAMPEILAALEHALRSGGRPSRDRAVGLTGDVATAYQALSQVILEAADRAGLALRNDESRILVQFLVAAASAPNASRGRASTPSFDVLLVEAHGRIDELASVARASRAQLSTVIDALPFLISFVTHDERYGLVNKAYEDWFHVSNRDIVGRRLVDVVGEAAYARLRPFVLRGLAGERFSFEQLGVPYGSGTRDIRGTFVPQLDERGAVSGYVALLEDISWRLRLEAERETASRDRTQVLADQAAFERQLIGIVSHDLCNPLNVVSLGSKLLLAAGELPPFVAKQALRISTAAERAGRLVSDLLDFTQARHGGGLSIQRAARDLRPIVESVVSEVQASYPARRIELHQARAGAGMWDADRIAQVVQNLVTNACKYSPADSTVAITVTEGAEDVTLVVHNVGDPIPPDKLASLFEPYERAAAQPEGANRSIGLGLYIVKLIVGAHGGAVRVESQRASGTTFSVSLPRAERA